MVDVTAPEGTGYVAEPFWVSDCVYGCSQSSLRIHLYTQGLRWNRVLEEQEWEYSLDSRCICHTLSLHVVYTCKDGGMESHIHL